MSFLSIIRVINVTPSRHWLLMGSIDIAYGQTPQEALGACILKHYAFSQHDVEFLNGRPDFMDVEPRDVSRHDWDQYEPEGPGPSSQTDGPTASARRSMQTPTSNEDRYRLTLSNIWCEVSGNKIRNNTFSDRAHVCFRFGLQLRESAWTGEDESRPEDNLWSCERISTKWLSKS